VGRLEKGPLASTGYFRLVFGILAVWLVVLYRGAASGDIWEYALVCDFDSFESLQKYSDDSYHIEVVNKLLPLFSARADCDFEIRSGQAESLIDERC
jgi:hypothetical protein